MKKNTAWHDSARACFTSPRTTNHISPPEDTHATLVSTYTHHIIAFTLTRCAPFASATFSGRACTDGAPLTAHLLRHSYAFDFRTLLLPLFENRCTHACLVSPQGCLEECVRTQERAELLLEHRGGEDDSWCGPYALTGAGRLSPYCSTCQCAHRSIIWATDASSAGGYAE